MPAHLSNAASPPDQGERRRLARDHGAAARIGRTAAVSRLDTLGQVLEPDHAVFREHAAGEQGLLELPDVERPVVGVESARCLSPKANALWVAVAQPGDESRDDQS